ncbi:MAG: SDR family NAD(P)-dependent oxidoreductase [Cognatishimia sp.]|uniref:SDR family NAD(P)-dependent oxidoreductase n=1 Tax=Cognatishimia sp. TaxID=2211648 RepID=UPI003B8CFDB6
MTKTILITGATDGIGLLTAKKLAAEGHTVLLHGRSKTKLENAAEEVGGNPETYIADLSKIADLHTLANDIHGNHATIDVIINNAGVLKLPNPTTAQGFDARFMVNTFAPYILTEALLPILSKGGRVVNLSSAAQAPVDLQAMLGQRQLDDMGAYAQSKLAITIWSHELAEELGEKAVVVAVNPGSLLASKMVKEGFGVAGSDLNIGADILIAAALGDTFANASGQYFDNDSQSFAKPHSAALDANHRSQVMQGIKEAVARLG